MSEVALLNPPIDLDLSARLIHTLRLRCEREQQKLLTTFLDRDQYVKTFSAAQALESALDALEQEYRSTTNK